MEHARLVDDGKIQFVEAKLRVCAGLARERKFAVAVFVQRDECQRRENIVGCDKSFRFDPSLAESIGQQLSERVRANLSEPSSAALPPNLAIAARKFAGAPPGCAVIVG